MAIKCCKDCVAPKRYPGCHDHCPEYIKEKTAYDAKMAEEHRKRAIKNGLDSQTCNVIHKAYKRMRGR